MVERRRDRRAQVGRPRARRVAIGVAPVLALVLVLSGCVINGSWAAVPAGVVPVQGTAITFADVDCVATDWCMAVGSMGDLPMVQTWNGASWTVATAPPIAPSAGNAEMVSVDCATPTSCVARINRYPDGPDDFQFVVVWNGQQWLDVPPGDTLDGPYPDVAPYSCSSDGSCLIVPQDVGETVVWNGSQFAITPFSVSYPDFDLIGVSCLAADNCLALVSDGLIRWNGSSWSALIAGSQPPPGIVLADVAFGTPVAFACASDTDCVTHGTVHPAGTRVGMHWDGSGWASDPLPDGPSATELTITELSCAGPSECVGIWSEGGEHGAVAWNGDSWYEAPTPPLGIGRLSCLPLWCLGVGSTGSPSTPIAATYTWTNP